MSETTYKAMYKRLAVVTLFAVGLAYIESAVVVYLRALFYADGFTFPLADFAANPLLRELLLVEVAREAATLLVLFTASWLIGSNFQTRLAYFLATFAVWDIFYYVWLRVLLDWPATLMDWDILFLIPTTWAGPVLAPVLVSLTMIAFALMILHRQCQARPMRTSRWHVIGFTLAGLVIVGTFCQAGIHASEPDFDSYFSWPLFIAAEIFALLLFLTIPLYQRDSATTTGNK